MFLHGKIALVTGGSGALGGSVVDSLLYAGARVAIASRSSRGSTVAESESKRPCLFNADVTVESDVLSLFHRVEEEMGTVEILINLAGGYLPGRPIGETDSADWDNMMGLNLRSVFLCSRQYLRKLRSRDYGRIINIATIYALDPTAGTGAYAISKAGVVMLSRLMSEESRGTGITVNVIAPGIIRTKANIESMPNADHNRWVAPDEIGRLIIHLCSEHGKSITGACIPLFGGA